jgi:hypothetical protein
MSVRWLLALLLVPTALVACPGSKIPPKMPPPEYEPEAPPNGSQPPTTDAGVTNP